MCSTKSRSQTAPATDLILVSHGSPSDPAPQEAFIRALAARVSACSGLTVRGATLAAKGSLEAAVAGLNTPMIFPHFMADGWFVSTNLPRRLQEAGLESWDMMQPLGLVPGLPQLVADSLERSVAARIYPQFEARLVIAAHGSPSDPRPARATELFAAKLTASCRFTGIEIGYVDEAPKVVDALRGAGDAILLPFFAAKAGHVLVDLREAVEEAGFRGSVLPPLGTWSNIPSLIAQAAATARKDRAA